MWSLKRTIIKPPKRWSQVDSWWIVPSLLLSFFHIFPVLYTTTRYRYHFIISITFIFVLGTVLEARFPMTCIAGTTLYFLFSTLYCFYTHLTFRGNRDFFFDRFVWDLGFLAIISCYTPSLGRSDSGPEPHSHMRQGQHIFIQSRLLTRYFFFSIFNKSLISICLLYTWYTASVHFVHRFYMLFSVRISEICFVYKQNIHRCALHVTIFYGNTIFSTLSGIVICLKQPMHQCALHVPIFYKYAFFTVLLFSVKLSEIVDYNQNMHRCALHVTIFCKHTFLQQYYLQ